MRYVTAVAYGILGLAGLFAGVLWVGAVHGGTAVFLMNGLAWLPLDRAVLLIELEAAGVFTVGVGVGTTAWLVTGQEVFRCLGQRVPHAWRLWRRDILTSLVPVFKYLLGAVLIGALGSVLFQYLWGLWTDAYDVGLVVGAGMGAVHSVWHLNQKGVRLEFLEANHRYLNDQKVSVFSETEKP